MFKDVGCGMQAGLGMQDAGGGIGFTVMDVLSRIQPKPVDADPGIQGSCHPSSFTSYIGECSCMHKLHDYMSAGWGLMLMLAISSSIMAYKAALSGAQTSQQNSISKRFFRNSKWHILNIIPELVVQTFAQNFRKRNPPLHVLVCNGNPWQVPKSENPTEDGFVCQTVM